MATFPIGNFGNQVARPGPVTNSPGPDLVGQAADRTGQIAFGVAVDNAAQETQRQQVMFRAQSALALAKATNAMNEVHDDVKRRIEDGSLTPEQASAEFGKSVNKVRDSSLSGYGEQQRLEMDAHLMGVQGTLGRNLQGVVVKRQQQETASFLDQYAEEQSRIAMREPGGPAKATERVRAMLKFSGPAAGLNPAQLEKLGQAFDERVHATFFEQAGIGALTKGDVAGLQSLREQVQGPAGERMDPGKRATLTHQLYTWQKQLEHQAKSEQDAAEQVAFSELQGLRKFADAGQAPNQDYIERFTQAVKGTRSEQEGMRLLNLAVIGGAYGSQSLPDQKRYLETASRQPMNYDEADRLAHMRSITATQEAAYKDDQWGAAERFQRGFPMTPAQPVLAVGQLLKIAAERVPLMSKLEVASGMPAELLRPAEVPQAVDQLQKASIRERTEILGQIGSMLTPKQVEALSAQIEKGSKPLALTLKLGTDRTTAGRMASELVQIGAQALHDKTVKRDDTALAGWRAEIAGMVRGSLGDPKAEDDVIEAAYYIRAAQELDTAAAPGFKLPAGADKAVEMVIGKPLERAGVKTFLPKGMDENTFDEKARKLLAAGAGQTVYLRGQPVTVEGLANRWTSYGVRLVRPGEYMPISGNAPFTVDKEGQQPLRLKVQ